MNAYRWTPTHTRAGPDRRRRGQRRATRRRVPIRFPNAARGRRDARGGPAVRTRREVQRRPVLVRPQPNRGRGAEHRAEGVRPGRGPDDPSLPFRRRPTRTKASRLTSLRGDAVPPRDRGQGRGRAPAGVRAQHRADAVFGPRGGAILHLRKLDASFLQYHFAMLADERRARAYDEAIQPRRRGDQARRRGQVLTSARSGLLSMMAARAGARSALACEWHGSLAACARRNVAANRMSDAVTVARGDAAKLRRASRASRSRGVTWSSSICSTRA